MTPSKSKSHLAARTLCLLVALTTASSGSFGAPPPDYLLKNGLRIIVRQRHETTLVAIDLWVRGGSREEAVGEAGAAHFLEHTLFKGTTTRGVGEADMAIENLGATLNAATSADYARFYTSVSAMYAGDALLVLADVVRNATLPTLEVDRERQVIQDELAQRNSDPASVLVDRSYAVAFAGKTYGTAPSGTSAAIGGQTRNTLAGFYHRTYRPDRCTLILVGDITPEAGRKIAEASFGDWIAPVAAAAALTNGPFPGQLSQGQNGDGRDPKSEKTTGAATPIGRPIVEAADIARPIVGIAVPAPPAAEASSLCAAQVVAAILGQSELGGRLAIPKLLGSGARVTLNGRINESLFIVSAGVPATEERAMSHEEIVAAASVQNQALQEVLNGLISTPPTGGEVAAAKSALLGRSIFENETNSGEAAALGTAEVTGGLTPAQWRVEIETITAAQVRKFIAQWMGPERRTALTIVPRGGKSVANAER